jgi:predicted regulator of Ras-like GTPase activity (Roadblock/LC7/MglB family)
LFWFWRQRQEFTPPAPDALPGRADPLLSPPGRSRQDGDLSASPMPELPAYTGAGLAASAAALKQVREGLGRSGRVLAVAVGTVAASLSELNNSAVDPQLISRITAAASSHGVAAADLLSKLPGELEQLGAAAVDAFLRGGDALGKHWSPIESQAHAPHRTAQAANGIWEDGTVNISRGGADMSWLERIRASADNHLDGLIAAAQTPEFWQRTLGNAVEASVYAAAMAAVDQLLVHRDMLINGTKKQRQQVLLQILQTSGLMAAGTLPVSAVLAIALMLVPGLAVVMGPLGMLGTAGLGLRLLSSAVRHPSRQELRAIQQLQGLLRETLYALQRDREGNLTITVQAQPAG